MKRETVDNIFVSSTHCFNSFTLSKVRLVSGLMSFPGQFIPITGLHESARKVTLQ